MSRRTRGTLEAVGRGARALDPLALAALHTVDDADRLGLHRAGVPRGALAPEAAWAAAHVDEDWQMSLWGEDDEATRAASALAALAASWRRRAADLGGPRGQGRSDSSVAVAASAGL